MRSTAARAKTTGSAGPTRTGSAGASKALSLIQATPFAEKVNLLEHQDLSNLQLAHCQSVPPPRSRHRLPRDLPRSAKPVHDARRPPRRYSRRFARAVPRRHACAQALTAVSGSGREKIDPRRSYDARAARYPRAVALCLVLIAAVLALLSGSSARDYLSDRQRAKSDARDLGGREPL